MKIDALGVNLDPVESAALATLVSEHLNHTTEAGIAAALLSARYDAAAATKTTINATVPDQPA